MATKNRRVPVTLNAHLEKVLQEFQAQTDVSLSQALLFLATVGAQNLEDDYWAELADSLDGQVESWQPHDKFWDEVLAD